MRGKDRWLGAYRQCIGEQKGSYRRYILLYTIVFLIAVCGVYYCFWHNGKSFIGRWFQVGDGLRQHYPAFVYFGRWGRKLLYNLFVNHQMVIPTWDFSIGYGTDIITTLHYYVLGDPLGLVALITPLSAAEYVFSALVLVRLYLAGLFFSCFCFRFDLNRVGTLCGAVSYVFCGFALFASVRHPFFLNPMIYLPLLLLGAERVLHREKPGLFILAVFIAGASNFYFFYVLVIFTVLYVMFRCFMLFSAPRIREIALAALRLGGFALIGVAMAAVILVPILISFLGDNRLASDYATQIFYNYGYYELLLNSALTSADAGSWTVIAFTPGVILAIFLLFFRRGEHRALKIAFLLLTAFLLLPLCGRFLNGFSYATNRWCWAYSFLSCLILAVLWPELMTTTRREHKGMVLLVGVLAALAMILPTCRSSNVFMALLLLTATLTVLLYHAGAADETNQLRTSGAMLAITILSVVISAFFRYSQQTGNVVYGFLDMDTAASTLVQTEDVAVKQAQKELGDTAFSRYAVCPALTDLTHVNSAMIAGTYGTEYYWSLSNQNISQYLREMDNLEYFTYRYRGLDDRTALLELASVGYYTVPAAYQQKNASDQYVPYGYEFEGQYCVDRSMVQLALDAAKKTKGAELSKNETDRIKALYGEYYNVYRNRYALPLGYTYSSWMSRADYETLSATGKQETQLNSVVLDRDVDTVPKREADLDQKHLGYTVECGAGVTWEDGKFHVTSDDATVMIHFDGLANSETDVGLTGLKYTGIPLLNQYSEAELDQMSRYYQLQKKHQARYWEESDTYSLSLQCGTVSKTLESHPDTYIWYNNRQDFVANLGYRQKPATEITITFSDVGVYTYDSLQVTCQPMDAYAERVSALTRNTLQNVKIDANQVSGTIALNQNKILCLSIPYSSGWTAYVDGRKTELLRANTMYAALPLTAGSHTIKLRYVTRGLSAGLTLTGIGILSFCGVLFYFRRSKGRDHH